MSGRILVGNHDGVYVIRFEGDVRVTMCGSFDHYLESMLSDSNFASVLVDLSDTVAVDSTSLGVLAKLSIAVQSATGKIPTLVCASDDIYRILANMGFGDVFAIVRSPVVTQQSLAELPVATDLAEEEMRHRVIQAHRTLMDMNESNREAFKDLVAALEAEGSQNKPQQRSA